MTVLSPTDDWLMVSFYWMYDCLNESFPWMNEPFIDSLIYMNERSLFEGLGFIL
jgi:hypothetical protein